MRKQGRRAAHAGPVSAPAAAPRIGAAPGQVESFLDFAPHRRHWANAVLAVDNAWQQSELNIAQHELAFKYKNQHLEFASAAGIRKLRVAPSGSANPMPAQHRKRSKTIAVIWSPAGLSPVPLVGPH
ncbi:hypothetical protein CBM2633_A80060 [Cupriavidus taiwanensis]|nr:hypothetical protein CBM2604_A100258 [Cupriavidus taiwanensis]SOZ23970.1 hypothetical protein CBM2609_A120262 [Cupriavidus taiwanensis]SOZ44343.1 hypothetical protein CBM2610_A120261 [Cupriavidus taiwanensis]SPA17357.1 hypothetical protein CBM2633_A80060 [Cupriavidus taiwanensis]